MTFRYRTCSAVAILSIAGAMASAQDAPTAAGLQLVVPAEGETQELRLRDGTRAFGRVERVDGDRVTFRTTSGAALELEVGQIVTLRTVEGRVVNGEFRPADPNPTRLFFAPTGRSLPQGAAYLGVYEILLPFVQVGLTDRVSIGAGTPLFFGGGADHPFWITPKIQVLAARNTHASLGVLHFMNVGDGSLGIAYGVVTQGSADSAVTFGIGYGYERSYGDDDGAVIAMVGGEHRVTRAIKIISENYIFSEGGLASAGVRLLGDRLSADLGLVVPVGAGELIAFPIVNFVWRFSRD